MLCEEFQLIALEMRAGLRRTDALKMFAERTGEEQIQRLVAILVQNDRFGTSMADSLRTHSQFMRGRRRQEIEIVELNEKKQARRPAGSCAAKVANYDRNSGAPMPNPFNNFCRATAFGSSPLASPVRSARAKATTMGGPFW